MAQIRKTPRSQVLAPQGSRKGEEEHTHIEGDMISRRSGHEPEARTRRRRVWRESRRKGMEGEELRARVPGLPIRDCTGSSNNLISRYNQGERT